MTQRIESIKLLDICHDGGTQVRKLNNAAVDEYADNMRAGDKFPPVVVYLDGKIRWLSEGFHRYWATAKAEISEIQAEVRHGGRREALINALKSNHTHGLKRTNEDKRNYVQVALQDEELRKWSDRALAELCGVHHQMVADVRRASPQVDDSSTSRTGSDGKQYPVKKPGIKPTTITTCDSCGETFDRNVWHCHDCGKHWPDSDSQCPECGPGTQQEQPTEDQGQESMDPTLEPGAAEPERPRNKMAVHHSSDSPEHYTPRAVLDLVVDCLGKIDLDPCSNSHVTPNVPAARHYTIEDNGLERQWKGLVFLNPPYGREIPEWIAKLVEAHLAGSVPEAIALVPARVDTAWFALLRDSIVCFVRGRLQFIGNEDPAPFPSAIAYLGPRQGRFLEVFGGMGDIWTRLGGEVRR